MNSLTLTKIAMMMLGLSFIFYLLSNYLPQWGTTSPAFTTFGLWKICFDPSMNGTSRLECANIKCSTKDSKGDVCLKVLIAKLMITAACIFTPIASILLVLFIQKKEIFNRTILILVKAIGLMGLVTGIIGLAFGINGILGKSNGEIRLGYAAIFAIVAVVLDFIGIVASVFIQKDE